MSQDVLGGCEEISDLVPEFSANQDELTTHMLRLMRRFGFPEGWSEDTPSVLVLAGVTQRWMEGESIAANSFLGHVSAVLRDSQQPDSAPGQSAYELSVYDKYTDPALSRDIKTAIDRGLLDKVKAKMGITPETETPYDVRVLDIDLADQAKSMPPAIQADLVRRKAEFMEALEEGELLSRSSAWRTGVGGIDTICISVPLATQILKAERRKLPSISVARAILDHEYGHSPEQLSSADGRIGSSLEERRAEHFAGDYSGAYRELKDFFDFYWVLTGTDFHQFFDSLPTGGGRLAVYSQVARDVGLCLMTEVLLTQPSVYARAEKNKHMLAVQEGLECRSAILDRILHHLGLTVEVCKRASTKPEYLEAINITATAN